jgi:lipopolysaccharide export system ATP-binding protein
MLKVQQISKSYNSRLVVKDVSIDVGDGQIVGLMGPNGSGKTTCFNMIVGLVCQDSGSINFNGQDISDLPIYQRSQMGICYLPQEPSVFHGLSVEDNIMAVLELQPLSKAHRIQKLTELMGDFKITHLAKSKASLLSGGERRRLEIAKTIAINPKVILLDEPFVGIDPILINDIKNIILKLRDSGISFLITDHSVYQALQIIDMCYIIYNGSIIVADTKDKVVANPLVKELYLGENFNLG